ncbi:MAG TPA: LptE family protein [Candidatus Acidoferrales bacterium]|nr:LptE family protein [Candidatus Acidoferrales bacterium]
MSLKRSARTAPGSRDWNLRSRAGWFGLVLAALAGANFGCGYGVAGRATRIPPDVKTIAVVPFVNKTSTYRIEQRMSQAVVQEFISRTKYRIVSDPKDADAVLHGEITSLDSIAVVYDTTTGRATTMLVTVNMKVELEDRNSKPLFQSDNFVFRQPYEISTDITSFFDEESPALDRMAHDFAARLVSDVLENF